MKLKVTASPSEEDTRNFTVDVESDLGLSEKQWDKLSILDKEHTLQLFLDELNEQPYWSLDNYIKNN